MGKTYNPIGPTQDYENGFFSPIPVPPPGYANVLTGGQNERMPLVIQNGDIPRKEQIRQGKYRWITRIDICPHEVSFDVDLLARDNISHFRLTADMTACVERPGQVCLDSTIDVAAAVRSSLHPELQAKAIQYNVDNIQQLRDDINDWLKDVISLNSGIQLTDIRIHIQPDQAYIDRQEFIRQEEQKKADKLRQLRDKGEYEKARAKVADELSKEYNSEITQAFAELASDDISPEEVARRIEVRRKNQSAEIFDEKMRQMREAIQLVKLMQDSGMGSPDILAQKADQLLGGLLASSPAALNGGSPSVQALEESSSEQVEDGLFVPPIDD